MVVEFLLQELLARISIFIMTNSFCFFLDECCKGARMYVHALAEKSEHYTHNTHTCFIAWRAYCLINYHLILYLNNSLASLVSIVVFSFKKGHLDYSNLIKVTEIDRSPCVWALKLSTHKEMLTALLRQQSNLVDTKSQLHVQCVNRRAQSEIYVFYYVDVIFNRNILDIIVTNRHFVSIYSCYEHVIFIFISVLNVIGW